jgi:lipopolysaccharide/colanic/teichoic acid biosynthesis glycosyltransferase
MTLPDASPPGEARALSGVETRQLLQLLDAAIFQDVLVRERRRAERSGHAFALLLLQADGRPGTQPPPIGTAALDALASAIRETDIAGWLQPPTVLGVILSELQGPNPAEVAAMVRARLRREIGKRLKPGSGAGYSLGLHVFPEPGGAPGSVDPVLHPDVEAAGRRRRASDLAKRALDIAGSLALLALLSPLLLLIAALVRLTSPGPVLFRQQRIGRMLRPFPMLKFRSMYVDADPRLHQDYVSRFIRKNAPASVGENGQVFKLTADPRVTPLGRFLRRTSLDELPQLWNVLRGDMSLVGPRPPLAYEVAQYAPWHRRRLLEAKPGITGLWQVRGRSRTTFDEMVRLDLRYARRRSLWTDLKILLRTPAAVMSGKGAS